jgi:prolipoprotein diacylglyceryl transferase
MPVAALLASIPSPSRNEIGIGPVRANAYGMCIAVGVIAAVWLSRRRWQALGGNPDQVSAIAMWGVPSGVIGARLYHVATDWRSFQGRWHEVPFIWKGGLGIWGGVALGVLGGMYGAQRQGVPVGTLVDVAAPAIPLAQAIGRWGNWFNQEVFGRPTTLPWGLEISPRRRPRGYEEFATFHPTFLYESLWNLLVVAVVLVAERRWKGRLRPGRLFAVYAVAYTTGRFFIETVRIDTASRVGGLRVNLWVAGVIFICALIILVRELLRSRSQTVAKPAQ